MTGFVTTWGCGGTFADFRLDLKKKDLKSMVSSYFTLQNN